MKVLKPLHFDQSGRIAIHVNNRLEMITINRITYCEANGNYTFIHLADGNKYMTACNLHSVYEKLKDFGFFTIDKSYVVNLLFIKAITQERNAKVLLDPEGELKIARSRKPALMDLLLNPDYTTKRTGSTNAVTVG
ncbi:MAG TPA: LytTR family DNA-binding domain-containing protein [Bacteroidales bacterium]|nr:LytTR family DNA-binding domain-containing protein [Bacteroidales bacterium]